ncbi:hypothetical protein RDI58_001047 [Solanum bulbocastanum]|uniref:Uncharacterized protein n=1 Tax=Solanum bulbocastanum TaxID=147425 RepID=A0AAN8YMU9_SOLBU
MSLLQEVSTGSNADAANILTNDSILLVLVKMLRHSKVTGPIISLVSSLLRNEEVDIIQLYALRTIESISSQGGYWSACFTSQYVITNLCYIIRAPGKQEIMRLIAGSCLTRLVRFSLSSIQRVMDKLSFKDMVSILVKRNPREQQICLNILNMTLIESQTLPSVGRYLLALVKDKNLVLYLLNLIEQGSEVLKGKVG